MDPLSVTTSIVAILQLSGKVVGYLTDVKDASKERANCAVEASNLHSLLLNLRFRLEEGSANTPWYAAVRALAIKNGPLDQYKQELEFLQTKMTDGGRLKKAGEALVWKFRKEDIASILGRMERLKTLVEIALQMDHFKLSQAIKDDTHVIKDNIDSVQTHMDDAEHRRLLEWISPTDYPAQQSDIIKRRQEGTGQWFLDAPEVTRWLSEAKGTLFCPGIPGAGKTMVAAIAIDHLLKSVQNSSHGVAYVYFNYKAQENQDASTMLAAILKQLVQARRSTMEPVERLYKQHANRGTRPSLDEVFGTLRDVLARHLTVHIVIDALDECRDGTRRQFLAKLRDLQAGRDIRLMATSRSIPEIVNAFPEALQLEVQASKEDVKRFVAGQIYRLPRCIQRDPALQGLVQDKIVEAVDGMFLLARLHTDSLLDKRTAKDVKSTLSRLSKGSYALEDAYRDALLRIEGQLGGDCELAKKVLLWITLAKRPLTTTELCCALAVEPDEAELDPENIPDVEDLVSVCAGLVVVDSESAVVRLVHYTTQDYFKRIGDTWNPTAQLDIASTCLTYLSFSEFKSGSCPSDEEFEERLQENGFLDYAAKHWGEHATAVEREVCGLACLFLSHSGSVSSAVQVLEVRRYRFRNYSQKYSKNTTPLHLAAQFGLSIISEAIIASQAQESAVVLDKENSARWTPLQIAAAHGHYRMVELLINKGADVDAGSDGSALHMASAEGHEAIVKVLVDLRADINAQGGVYDNALCAASEEGHEAIVKVLVALGADVNAQGGGYGTALQEASYSGHAQIVELLINSGADVNAQNKDYGTALQAASYKGHAEIVELLINKDADISAHTGTYGQTPLQLAARGGDVDTFQYLASLSPNPSTLDAKGDDVLCYASSGGSLEVLKVALNQGFTWSSESMHWSPLHWACRAGNPGVVELLIKEGLRSKYVTIPEPEGQWSPVDIAIFHDNEEMLNSLSAPCKALLGIEAGTTRRPGIYHRYVRCGRCFHDIYGPHFRCRICLDPYYCFMCRPLLDSLHPDHDWEVESYN